MKKTILLLIGIVSMSVSILTASAQDEKKIDWNSDLDFLAKELSEKHYDFFTVRSKEELSAGIEAIKAKSSLRSDFQTALSVQQLLASFGDSHTMLNFTALLDHRRILPMQLFWTSDGLHVRLTTAGNKELLGQRVEAIDGIPMKTVVDSLSTLFTIDNPAMVKSIVPEVISCLQVLEYLGITDGRQAELTLEGGKKYVLAPARPDEAHASFQPDSLCFADQNSNLIFTGRNFPEQRIYYMLYNSCRSRELEAAYGNPEKAAGMPSFEEFCENALRALADGQADKLVFDMRYNGGGNSTQGTKFVEALAKFLEKYPHIGVYVVLGRQTFSSAILNAMDFKRLTNSLFVGEQTAGKPNHFGEVRSFQLPSSGLQVQYSTNYFKTTDEDLQTLTPDRTIERSFSDFTRGIDPVFEWIEQQPSQK